MPDLTLERQDTTILQLASFSLGGEEYAVEISMVQEIVRMTSVTRVPRAPAFVEGVVNLRGKIVPVIDLRRRFNLPVTDRTKATRIIIVNVVGKTVGLIVDQVREVLRIAADSISPPPELVANGLDATLFKGVGQFGERLIIMLDLQHLLTADEMAGLPGDAS